MLVEEAEEMSQRASFLLLIAAASLAVLGWAGTIWGQPKLLRVGVLVPVAGLSGDQAHLWWMPFRNALADQGWMEGKNLVFEYTSALTDSSQYGDAAAALVAAKVDVIWAPSGPGVRAAHSATRAIPIVAVDFTAEPIAEGYVESYSRPGGNLTGIFLDAPEFAAKWFELLTTIIPNLSRVAVLWDPRAGTTHLRAIQEVARPLRVQLDVHEVQTVDDLDKAFSELRGTPHALICLPSPMIYIHSARLAKLALMRKLPATSMARAFAKAGGMLVYGPQQMPIYERSAVQVAKILGGAKPADVPAERAAKFELIVNLGTATTLGLTVPDSVLYRADEVIR
jgi:putative ABC transport system substrate-binding protein